MSNKQAINLTSMSLIEGELMTTISEASTHLETFISERDNQKVLDDCISSLQQIRGSLDLIQLYGACELAGEILSTATAIDIEKHTALDDKLSALTKSFFILSCYFEYAQQHQAGMPVLLVPYINDLRLVNRQAVMPESYFEPSVSEYRCPPSPMEFMATKNESLQTILRRFRHMYQLGLLGVVKELNVEYALTLMQRACTKVYRFSKGRKSETLWWLASNALQAFVDAEITPSVARKRLFTTIDKQLRLLEKQGDNAFDQAPPEPLLIELAYYIALAAEGNDDYAKIKQLYGFNELSYTEKTLQRETAALTGPNAKTVQSVAEVLRVELSVAKENMERSQVTEGVEGDYEDTISRIQRVKDILHVVGLTSAAKVIGAALDILITANESKQCLDEDGNMVVVDAFLYVESVLNSLAKRNFSGEQLDEMNQLNQNEMISSNNLLDAQLMVIEEAEKGIVQIKQALTAFTDSEYDKEHITNFATQLQEIRGGMIVLDLPRAASIVTACHEFIEKSLMSTDETAALEYMLETFADALICLEYYLGCMKVDKLVSADNLAIAEESLAALGYPVKAQ